MFELNEVLVPVDFSIASRETFARALAMVDGESPAVILLHVIDPVLVEAISSVTGEPAAAVAGRLRARAEDEMAAMADSAASVEIVRMVTEGTPFYEIARHADELAVDAVVIAKTGQRDAREGLFFGSTAEKVVRACREPVIVLTHDA
jgi:nucleotide-binding universal stress UspA family protein